MNTLIGFNTLDKGMVYYEYDTDYRVRPEIGKTYTDCVEGNHYIQSVGSIIDILSVG